MLRGYLDSDTLCPFYLSDNYNKDKSQSIECESPFKGCKNSSIFASKTAKLTHKKYVCNSTAYKVCPIYKMLMEKYDDE